MGDGARADVASAAASPGRVPGALAMVGGVLAAAGLGVLARQAFPVQDEQLLWPSIGVGAVVLGALCLRVDPLAPLRKDRSVPHLPEGS